jgi:molybdenum cofactor cytidylyltransferase
MGRPKALLHAGAGRTFLERVCATLARGGCAPVLVVLREGDTAERELAERVGARVIVNPTPDAGPITSVRCALAQVERSQAAGIAVLPVDHPLVEPATVEELLAAFDAHRDADVVVPTHEGRRGHPVLFRQALFAEIRDDDLPEGLRTVLRRDPSRVREVPVEDEGVRVDLDTPEALRRWLPEALDGDGPR